MIALAIERHWWPLLIFFRGLIGTRGIVKMLLSGLAISIIELGGLALVFPFLKLVTDADFHQRLLGLVLHTPMMDILSERKSAVAVIGLGMLAFYVARGWLTTQLTRYQANVAAGINSLTSRQLIEESLASRYQLFLEHSPSKLAGFSYSNTTHAALLFQSLTTVLNEVALFVLVLSGIIYASPLTFAYLLVLVGAFGLFFFRPLARQVSSIGRQAQEVDLARHRFIFAMASAIRDIKIMGLESQFARRNSELAVRHAQLTAKYSSISAMQRTAIEVVLVCGVIVAAIWFTLSDGDLARAVPFVGTLGLIAVRLAPGLARLVGAYNGFRYSLPFVESLIDMRQELGKYPQKRNEALTDFPGEYKATDLCFSYGEKKVLTDCSIQIGQGEVVAIIGPSGSGKSTLLDLLAGLQVPGQGHFWLSGKEFSPFRSSTFPLRIGYVPQAIALLDDSLAFNIALENQPDMTRLDRAIRQACLQSLVDGLPKGLQTKLGEGGQGLSGGQRQRLGIARALYRDPSLLILDEVTSALDEETARAVLREILSMRGQVSMLLVTHDVRLLEVDRLYRMNQGCLEEVMGAVDGGER